MYLWRLLPNFSPSKIINAIKKAALGWNIVEGTGA
jgi:hypothetical protein